MNEFISKHLVYKPLQYLRKQDISTFYKEMVANQYKSLADIEDIRNRKLRNIVNSAYENLYYYREIFDKLGIKPNAIENIDDLQKLPVLSKRDVLENEKSLISSHCKEKLYTRKTGGSTGMTLHFMKEAKALALNDAVMWRCYKWYDIDIGDKQVRFWGVPVTSGLRWKEQLKDFILNRIRISAFDISESSCLEYYKKIKRFKPAYFYGYTTAIYGFCLFMKKAGINLHELNLKAVICTAEKMYPHHLELFKEVFNCPVVDEYGSSETGIISFQCKSGNMHLMSDHLCIEFLDEDSNHVKAGETGRIVVTDLASYAMPLIRYDIGDMGKASDDKCSCGINLPLMEIIEGRKEDFIRTKDGKLVHAAYLCYTLKDDAVNEFKMYQKDINTIFVQIVKSPMFSPDTEKYLEDKLRTALGKSIAISFEYLDRIPRETSGKLRYFVSQINNG
jgi:phenylacetate-CoA ligase